MIHRSLPDLQTGVTVLTWPMSLQVGITSLEGKYHGPFGYGQKILPSKSPVQQDPVLQGEVQTGHQEAWESHSSSMWCWHLIRNSE